MKIDFIPHKYCRDIRVPVIFEILHPIIHTFLIKNMNFSQEIDRLLKEFSSVTSKTSITPSTFL